MATALDLEEEEVTLGTNAEAMEAASSELNSYQGIPLGELTSEQIIKIASSDNIALVHGWSRQVGMLVMKFTNYFETFKPIVMSMKQKLCAPRGSHRKTVIDGIDVTWAEYCKTYYGCSYRWVAKLIDGEYQPVNGEDAVDEVRSATEEADDVEAQQTEAPKLGRKDRTIVELGKSNDKLKEEISSLKDRLSKLTLKPAQQKYEATSLVDTNDPYHYFHQFKNEPQTLASEMAAMLIEFHFDEHATTSLIELLKKQIKAQRKILAA